MPDDNILCPACTKKLRMRDSDLGAMVQCPLCAAVFRTPVRLTASTSPTPPPVAPGAAIPRTPPLPEPRVAPATQPTPAPVLLEPHTPVDVQRAVLLPGMTLLICGVLNAIYPLVLLAQLYSSGPAKIAAMQEEGAPELLKTWLRSQELDDNQIIANTLLSCGFLFVVAIGMIVGAVNMLRLHHYWLAMVGCMLAFLPSPMCLFTAPLAIWSLRILTIREVREAFGTPSEEPEEEQPAEEG